MSNSNSRRSRNADLWNAFNRLMIGLIWAGVVAFVVFSFYPEWRRRNELSLTLEKQKQELAGEQLLQKQRSREVNLLQNDPGYVEVIARDKLDVMKTGETIIRLEGSTNAAPSP